MVDSPEQKMATSPLLQTKLYVPRSGPGLVPRPRLIQRLNQGTLGRLTIISAPAGFGKTTLLAAWLATSEAGQGRAAFVALDQSYNEPALFWAYFIAALQTVDAQIGKNTLVLLHSPQPVPVETLLRTLLNDVGALAERVVLVLDDYHLIGAQPIHQGIGFLLDHLPSQLRLVIADRADPSLPLSRSAVCARGELAEVRAADLRFTGDEPAAFLNEVMGLHLPLEDIATLETRTEGWIAGLQLAALSMQGREDVAGFIRAFAGDDRYIVDYLAEEVLQCQSAQVRSFLLQTSILHRLTDPLCDAVTGLAARARASTGTRSRTISSRSWRTNGGQDLRSCNGCSGWSTCGPTARCGCTRDLVHAQARLRPAVELRAGDGSRCHGRGFGRCPIESGQA